MAAGNQRSAGFGNSDAQGEDDNGLMVISIMVISIMVISKMG